MLASEHTCLAVYRVISERLRAGGVSVEGLWQSVVGWVGLGSQWSRLVAFR